MFAVTAILSCVIKIRGLFKSTKWRHFENVKFEALSARCVEQLDITTDHQLEWDKHVDKLCKKLSSALFSMRQVKLLPKSSLLTIYKSLVESRLRYCNVAWGSCGTSLINKMQHLQNHAVELIYPESESVDIGRIVTS